MGVIATRPGGACSRPRNPERVTLYAGLVGCAAGVLVSPVADRIATNAPLHQPLLGSVPRSRRLPLLLFALTLLGGACGLVFGFTLEAAAAVLLCWVLVLITCTDLEHRLIPDAIVLPGAVSHEASGRKASKVAIYGVEAAGQRDAVRTRRIAAECRTAPPA